MLRRVAAQEKRVSLIGVATLYILTFNGAMMLATGSYRMLHWQELALLLTIGGKVTTVVIGTTDQGGQ